MNKIILTLTVLLLSYVPAYAGNVITNIITPSACVTVGTGATWTSQAYPIGGYDGYIAYSFTGVDASGGNFTQTNAYLAFQTWDSTTSSNFLSYSGTPVLYGSDGLIATSATQITPTTAQTPTQTNTAVLKGSVAAIQSQYIEWMIINQSGNSITACTLNMITR